MVDLTGYDFEIKTYFNSGRAINAQCLAILPLEAKRKLQKCKYSQNPSLTTPVCSRHRQ